MIPEGWQEAKLQDVAPVIDCKHKTPRYAAQGVPIVSPGNLAWGALKLDGCRTISEADHAEMMDHCSVAIGDVVFGRNQSVGVSSIVTTDSPFALGQDTVLIKPTSISPGFLHQWLQSRQFELCILRLQGGSTFGRINLKDLRAVPTPVPPSNEADRIAKTLYTWDRAIETIEALITNARAQKQALMQQLLPQGTTPPKKRLPGFSGEWQETSLAELLSVKRAKGKIVPTNEHGDGVPYIGSTSFLGEFSNYTSSKDALLCVETDILVLWDGEYAGKVATGLAGAVSSTVGRYRLAKAKADPLFVVTLMEKASERIRSIREGSGIPHMPGDFEHWFKFALPTLEEQQAIAEVFRSHRVMADELQAQLTALHQEKAALMQQLLTGKRRVKLPESEAA